MNWDELPVLLTAEEARRLLNVGRVTIYTLCHREGFPAVRIGRAVRVSRDGLRSWIENQIVGRATAGGNKTNKK